MEKNEQKKEMEMLTSDQEQAAMSAERETPEIANISDTNQEEQRKDMANEDVSSVQKDDRIMPLAAHHEEEQENEQKEKRSPLSIFANKGKIDAPSSSDDPDLYAYAGFWIRFWAYIVDLIVVMSLRLILVRPSVLLLDLDTTGFFSLFNILSALIFFSYFVLMTKYFGQTLGKMVFGLKVISLKKDTLTWDTVIFRELVGRYICHTVKIVYILVGFLPKKQGLHDYFADTTVIHEDLVNKEGVEQVLNQHT